MRYLKHRNKTKIEIVNIEQSGWKWTLKTPHNQSIGTSAETFSSEQQCLDNLDSLGHDIIIFVKATNMR